MVPGMRSVVAASLVLVAAAALAASPAEPTRAAGETRLIILAWPKGQGKDADVRAWTLRCSPAGGTLPRAARACRLLLAQRAPFRPVPTDVACAEIWGGPAVARVDGRLRGRRVKARFKRTDSCHIDRWDRVRFLFPVRLA